MTINQLAANKIKELRSQLNIPAEVVAQELGIDKSNYSKLENGKVEITLTRIEALAKVFKVPMQSLLPIQMQRDINVNHGDYSFNESLVFNNHADPKLVDTIQQSVSVLSELLNKLR